MAFIPSQNSDNITANLFGNRVIITKDGMIEPINILSPPLLHPDILPLNTDYYVKLDTSPLTIQDLCFHCLQGGINRVIVDLSFYFVRFYHLSNLPKVKQSNISFEDFIKQLHNLCQSQKVTILYAVSYDLTQKSYFPKIKDVLGDKIVLTAFQKNNPDNLPVFTKFQLNGSATAAISIGSKNHRYYSGFLDPASIGSLHQVNALLVADANTSQTTSQWIRSQQLVYQQDFSCDSFITKCGTKLKISDFALHFAPVEQSPKVVKPIQAEAIPESSVLDGSDFPVILDNAFSDMFPTDDFKQRSSNISQFISQNQGFLQVKRTMLHPIVPHAVFLKNCCECQLLPNFSRYNDESVRVGLHCFYCLQDNVAGKQLAQFSHLSGNFEDFYQLCDDTEIRKLYDENVAQINLIQPEPALKYRYIKPTVGASKQEQNIHFFKEYRTVQLEINKMLNQNIYINNSMVIVVDGGVRKLLFLDQERFGSRALFINHLDIQIYYFGGLDKFIQFHNHGDFWQFISKNFNKDVSALAFDPQNAQKAFRKCDMIATTRQRIEQHRDLKEFLMERGFNEPGGIQTLIDLVFNYLEFGFIKLVPPVVTTLSE